MHTAGSAFEMQSKRIFSANFRKNVRAETAHRQQKANAATHLVYYPVAVALTTIRKAERYKSERWISEQKIRRETEKEREWSGNLYFSKQVCWVRKNCLCVVRLIKRLSIVCLNGKSFFTVRCCFCCRLFDCWQLSEPCRHERNAYRRKKTPLRSSFLSEFINIYRNFSVGKTRLDEVEMLCNWWRLPIVEIVEMDAKML